MTPMSAFLKAAKAWGFTVEGYPPCYGPGRLIDPNGRAMNVPWVPIPRSEATELDPTTEAELAEELRNRCWERLLQH